MAISLVQQSGGNSNSTSGLTGNLTVTDHFSSNTTFGSLLIASVRGVWGDIGSPSFDPGGFVPTMSVATSGVTWVGPITFPNAISGANGYVGFFYCANAPVVSSGTNSTVTAGQNGATGSGLVTVALYEFSHIANTPFDRSQQEYGVGSSGAKFPGITATGGGLYGPLVTTGAVDLVFMAVNGSTTDYSGGGGTGSAPPVQTAGTGYTLGVASNNGGSAYATRSATPNVNQFASWADQYNTNVSAGSYNPLFGTDWSVAAGHNGVEWQAGAIAFFSVESGEYFSPRWVSI